MEKMKVGSYDAARFIGEYFSVVTYMEAKIGTEAASFLRSLDPHDLITPEAHFVSFTQVLGFIFYTLAEAKRVVIVEGEDEDTGISSYSIYDSAGCAIAVDFASFEEAMQCAAQEKWMVVDRFN